MTRHREARPGRAAAGFLPAAAGIVLCLGGCKHEVKVDPIRIEPIYITLDIKLTVDRELDDFFDYQNDPAPSRTPDAGGVEGTGRARPGSIIMNRMHRVAWLCMLLAAIGAGATPAAAQPVDREQLQKQFEARDAILARLKTLGQASETWSGFVAVVADDDEAERVVRAENDDRRILYRLLAQDLAAKLDEPERSLMSPRVIAERNAVRNFQRAATTESLRVVEDAWVTKQQHGWLLRLLDLEGQQRIGEKRDGLVGPVRPEDGRNDEITRIVARENAARQAFYAERARERKVSAKSIATEYAERYRKAMHIGVLVEDEDGRWTPVAPGSAA